MLTVLAIFTVPAVASERGAGNDAKFASPFAVLCGATCSLRRDVTSELRGPVHTVSPAVAIAWRKRSFAFDSSQHDQVDAASIPALVRQITVEKY